MELKYVLTDNDSFALFSPTTEHDAIARALWGKPVSAGRCRIEIGYKMPNEYGLGDETREINVHCYGQSSSLGLQSRDEDEKIINKKLNEYYG